MFQLEAQGSGQLRYQARDFFLDHSIKFYVINTYFSFLLNQDLWQHVAIDSTPLVGKKWYSWPASK